MGLEDNILKIREKLGISAEKFGSLIGVTKQMVYEYEKGKSIPGKEVLAKIAEVGKISIADLYSESEVDFKPDENLIPEIYRNLLEAKTEYTLIPRRVLQEEYRIILKSEIDSRERLLGEVIDSKNNLIEQLKKEIIELREMQSRVQSKKA